MALCVLASDLQICQSSRRSNSRRQKLFDNNNDNKIDDKVGKHEVNATEHRMGRNHRKGKRTVLMSQYFTNFMMFNVHYFSVFSLFNVVTVKYTTSHKFF